MTYLKGQGLDLFLVGESKSPKDIRAYNSELIQLKLNFDKGMHHMVIHSIKLIEGGGKSSRRFCLIDHDEGDQTIFDVDYID